MCAQHAGAARAFFGAAPHRKRGPCSAAAAPRSLRGRIVAVAARGADASKGVLTTAHYAVPRRALLRGWTAAAGACLVSAFFTFAGDAGALELTPPLCTLLLRKLALLLKQNRSTLEVVQEWVRVDVEAAKTGVAKCEEAIALFDVLRAKCERAGDAACAQHYASRVESIQQHELLEARAELEAVSTTGWRQDRLRIALADAEELGRSYELLREYMLQQPDGAAWVAKADLPQTELSDEMLREQARTWRRPEAQ